MDPAPITPSSPQPSSPGSPFAPEQLRLGIIHLIVWTACTAICFSIYRDLHLLTFPDKAGDFSYT
jgi:hypothetical protein